MILDTSKSQEVFGLRGRVVMWSQALCRQQYVAPGALSRLMFPRTACCSLLFFFSPLPTQGGRLSALGVGCPIADTCLVTYLGSN